MTRSAATVAVDTVAGAGARRSASARLVAMADSRSRSSLEYGSSDSRGPSTSSTFALPVAERDRDEELGVRRGKPGEIVCRQLSPHAAGVGRHFQRLGQDARDLDQRAVGAQRRELAPQRAHHRQVTSAGRPHQKRRHPWMERLVDPCQDLVGNLVERLCPAGHLHHVSEHLLCRVPIAKEPAIERRHPPLALPEHDQAGCRDRQIDPAAIGNHLAHRQVAVAEHVGDEQRQRQRDERQQRATRHGVLQPEPDDDAQVEEPVPQDDVGERHREHHDHEVPHDGERLRRLGRPHDAQLRSDDLDRDPEVAHHADGNPGEHDAGAPPLGPIRRAA